MERYPGTNSAASYASEVQLIDPRNNIEKDYRIFMNNILNYGGYRFFQSSFDKDELGTYLSVNHDFWGTWISYLGYFLLTLGMIMTFFSKKTRFFQVTQKLKNMRVKRQAAALAIICISFLSTDAQKQIAPLYSVVDPLHADHFSEMVVQDHKGRMKPMHTLTRELMRKLVRKENFNGQSADQVDPDAFIRWTYAQALAHRQPRYAAMARNWGVTIAAKEIGDVRDAADFDELIERTLEARRKSA